ncbi:hypothetical protein QBC38DRAFT_463225 [Podospora fimiseda]|uniref:FAD-binding FR-type domain-containing protein n=1 Tax=Podospora fimiseda TaxID=252190 RepID=A0AAN7BZL8_9PEZI|nr:hypothetical protein QBC38DRAFT_463225 [Podospora fimiseda]
MFLFIIATFISLFSISLGNSSAQLNIFEIPFFYHQHFNPLIAMTTLQELHNGWHAGEQAVHKLLRVPTSSRENPTSSGLPPSYARRVTISPLVALGALDDQGRPWTAIWGGERGFIRPVAQGVLGLQSIVDKTNDPVLKSLLDGIPDGEVYQTADGQGKPISALSIDLESRDRVKLAGKMVVGTLGARPGTDSLGEVQMALHIQESLGNCPKYLNKKTIRAHIPSPELVSNTLPLPEEAVKLISQADMFFLSSTNNQTMDTNHRGGAPGFVRVLTNSESDGVTLVYPEYSGNRLYQTLGNLHVNPLIGLAIPDYETSSVLYLTGTTSLLVNPPSSILPHTKLAVKITVNSALYIRDSLPFRGEPGELSPYNPPICTSTSYSPESATAIASATLISRTLLSSTISKLTFFLKPERGHIIEPWKTAGHVTLDFSTELDNGYVHMNDDDPQSLNDDYIRSFTISSPPPTEVGKNGVQFEITARKTGGPVTGLLFRHDYKRVPLEIPVVGFGGGELRVSSGESKKKRVFVAGGVGITPLLSQVEDFEGGNDVEVVWSLRGDDLGLVGELKEGLRGNVKVFVTGDVKDEELEKARGLGVRIEKGRVKREDVLGLKDEDRGMRWLLCAGEGMLKVLQGWLEGEDDVVVESFGY